MRSGSIAVFFSIILLCSGVSRLPAQFPAIERISLRSDGSQADGDSLWPSLDLSGTHIVFASYADLIPDDGYDTSGICQVYFLDRATNTLQLVSVNAEGEPANADCRMPRISPGGFDVVFSTAADNLVAGDTNRQEDVFLRDVFSQRTELISRSYTGGHTTGGPSYNPDVCSIPAPPDQPLLDGYARYVVYTSEAASFGIPQVRRIMLYDRQTHSTELVGEGYDPSISGNGDRIAYHYLDLPMVRLWSATTGELGSINTPLQPMLGLNGDMVALVYAFDHNVYRSAVPPVQAPVKVSVSDDGTASGGVPLGDFPPAISLNGRYIAFQSTNANLVYGDRNMVMDVYVRDMQRGRTIRVSRSAEGVEGNGPSGDSTWVALSDNGYQVAFASLANNLVPGDTNDCIDIFAVDWLLLPPPPEPLRDSLLSALLRDTAPAPDLDQNGDELLDSSDAVFSIRAGTW